MSITATSLLYYLLVTRPAIRTTLDVHPDGTAAAAGAAAAAPKVRRGDTPRVHPWEGVDVIVDDNEERVREALLATPSAGYAYGMMVYCGKAARVVRYDKYDRQDGVLRATHGDGLTYTWPVALLTVAGAERVPALDPYHPIGVQKGDTLLVSAATEQVIALCRAEPAVGWRASMLPYIGTRAVVLRFDVADRRSGSVRLLHRDGAVHTWPLAATTVCRDGDAKGKQHSRCHTPRPLTLTLPPPFRRWCRSIWSSTFTGPTRSGTRRRSRACGSRGRRTSRKAKRCLFRTQWVTYALPYSVHCAHAHTHTAPCSSHTVSHETSHSATPDAAAS